MDINWLGLLQPQDASLPAQPGGCAKCHPGLGAKPNLPPTEADLNNVDCLLCHSPNYSRTVVKDEAGKPHLVPAEGVDVVAAAQNAQRPTSEMCDRCHLKAAGGPNFKHGEYPMPGTDVHRDAGMQCIDCHTTQAHKIAGGGYMIAQESPDVEVSCANCHTETPHTGALADRLNAHTARVACQTCHIPLLARDPNFPTQMTRDYSQPVYNAARGLYGPSVGKESHVIPTYFWWDYPWMNTPPWPVGSIDDPGAKITPWKPMEVTVPFDAETDTPIYIKQGVYQITGDLDAAVNAGVAASGQEYSGSWEAVTELMYFDAQHQVAPASEALACTDCHQPGGRLDFLALGYSPERAQELENLLATIPAGTHNLTARVFIDDRCDRFFQSGLDVPLAGVPVTLSFPDGTSETRQTTSFGLVYFSGFDGSDGVTVSVELPETYRGYVLDRCANNPASIELAGDDFQFGFKFVQFGARAAGESAGP